MALNTNSDKSSTKEPSMKAILYARFSPRPDSETTDSIEKQVERMRSLCVAFDHEIDGQYEDADKSGATVEGRDGLNAAIEHAIRVKGLLLCYDLSRLSRDTADGLAIIKRLCRRGACFTTVVERIDTTTPLGRLTFTFLTAINAYQRETNNLRTSNAMRAHQKNGRRMSKEPPWGWRPDPANPAKMIPCEAELAVVAAIRALRGEGLGLREIGRRLEQGGHQRRGKATWPHQIIRRILQREGVV